MKNIKKNYLIDSPLIGFGALVCLVLSLVVLSSSFLSDRRYVGDSHISNAMVLEANAQTKPVAKKDDLFKMLKDFKINIPVMNFAFSSMPNLDVSAFNMEAPSMGELDVFSNFSFDTNLGEEASQDLENVDLSSNVFSQIPDMMGPPEGTMGPPPGTVMGPPPGTVMGPPPGTVMGPPSGTMGPPAGTMGPPSGMGLPSGPIGIPAEGSSDCSSFAGIPNISFCSMIPDPQGKALCEQCKGQ